MKIAFLSLIFGLVSLGTAQAQNPMPPAANEECAFLLNPLARNINQIIDPGAITEAMTQESKTIPERVQNVLNQLADLKENMALQVQQMEQAKFDFSQVNFPGIPDDPAFARVAVARDLYRDATIDFDRATKAFKSKTISLKQEAEQFLKAESNFLSSVMPVREHLAYNYDLILETMKKIDGLLEKNSNVKLDLFGNPTGDYLPRGLPLQHPEQASEIQKSLLEILSVAKKVNPAPSVGTYKVSASNFDLGWLIKDPKNPAIVDLSAISKLGDIRNHLLKLSTQITDDFASLDQAVSRFIAATKVQWKLEEASQFGIEIPTFKNRADPNKPWEHDPY